MCGDMLNSQGCRHPSTLIHNSQENCDLRKGNIITVLDKRDRNSWCSEKVCGMSSALSQEELVDYWRGVGGWLYWLTE